MAEITPKDLRDALDYTTRLYHPLHSARLIEDCQQGSSCRTNLALIAAWDAQEESRETLRDAEPKHKTRPIASGATVCEYDCPCGGTGELPQRKPAALTQPTKGEQ